MITRGGEMAGDFEIKTYEKGELRVQEKPGLLEPKLYKVILHNDNYTTMDFVVSVIMIVFHKTAAEATRIMLQVHNEGFGVAGVYTRDIAVTKITQVHAMAKAKEFPLHCSYEEA